MLFPNMICRRWYSHAIIAFVLLGGRKDVAGDVRITKANNCNVFFRWHALDIFLLLMEGKKFNLMNRVSIKLDDLYWMDSSFCLVVELHSASQVESISSHS